MDELTEQIDQVLKNVARQSCNQTTPNCQRDSTWANVRLKDGSEHLVELTPDFRLGVGEDAGKLAEVIRQSKDWDVDGVDLPKPLAQKDVLQWSEQLSQAFFKAWSQRVDHTEFIEKVCTCGEGLMSQRQAALAYSEIYLRFSDRCLQLKSELEKNVSKADDNRPKKVAAVCRFYLGRCVALYQQTTLRDTSAQRRDSVESVREALRDTLAAVKFVNIFEVGLREGLYWIIYNSVVLALRVSRWLRLRGFACFSVEALQWLNQCVNNCLPMMAVSMVPLRGRLWLELIYGAESSMKLAWASKLCDEALEQLEKDKKLETMIDPVPEETVKVFDVALTRFRVLKIKYDYWTEKTVGEGKTQTTFGVRQAMTAAEELEPKSEWMFATLLEMLELQHNLPSQFGAPATDDVETGTFQVNKTVDKLATQGETDQGSISKLTLGKILTKRQEILEVVLERLKVHTDKAVAAAKFLENYTDRRLLFEAEEERRARSAEAEDAAPPASSTEAAAEGQSEGPSGQQAPIEKPERPSKEQLLELGFLEESPVHSVEQALPLSTHLTLARECLRSEIRNGSSDALAGKFKVLERSLALRLRYRHFFAPPLVDVDAIVTTQPKQSKVGLPEKYEFLTEDLNAQSHRNKQLESENATAAANQPVPTAASGRAATAGPRPGTGAKGKHVFVIGRRFDAWESWTRGGVNVPVRRLCNLRVAFCPKAPTNPASVPGAKGMFPTEASSGVDSKAGSWGRGYSMGQPTDQHGGSSEDSAAHGLSLPPGCLVKASYLKLPIDPHPGSCGPSELKPYLLFGIYEEQSLLACDAEGPRLAESFSAVQTLLPTSVPPEQGGPLAHLAVLDALNDIQNEGGDAGDKVGALLPTYSQTLDTADFAMTPLTDLSIFSTKHLHTPARGMTGPQARFNGLLQADLRQTPSDALGRPFQSYIFACAAVSAPSPGFVHRELLLLRAFEAVHRAFVSYESGASQGQEPPAQPTMQGEEEQDDAQEEAAGKVWKRPAVMDRLANFADVLSSTTEGPCGEVFFSGIADNLKDLCTYAFLTWMRKRIKLIQDALEMHERNERIISEEERRELEEWVVVVRKVLPVLLRVLERVRACDAMTLGAAAYALAKLYHQDGDGKSGQAALGVAIARMEDEISENCLPGIQPKMDQHVSTCVSFDPPSLRGPSFGLFQGERDECEEEAGTLLLPNQTRIQQERYCLLTTLYKTWIDFSLKAHLTNIGSTVRKVRHPDQLAEEDAHMLGGGETSTKLPLSNREAAVLARLGENSYLRSLFCVAIAKRRPEVATAALNKACTEVETAQAQERTLWENCEQELLRQQRIIRAGKTFGEEFTDKQAKKAGRKPRAHPPLPFGRSPCSIRLRLPPLMQGSQPVLLPSSVELEPAEQAFNREHHSETIGSRLASRTVLTAAVYGKAAGTGTAVSELHRNLPGTGLKRYGYDFVEISGLKPNTNYTFATMYFEGFEASRAAASAISETSPPIGTYFPLPLALLRVEICKQALASGPAGKGAWTRAWKPLFDSLCERTNPDEDKDSWGLRTYKLRLDVADRLPPAILAAFAELLLLTNNGYHSAKSKNTFPATRAAQQATLCAANECLIAVDVARRAASADLTLQGISLALRVAGRLMQYHTKPAILLPLLIKCSVALQGFAPSPDTLVWFAEARVTAIFLFHQIAMLTLQLGQKTALVRTLQPDVPQRYQAHPLALADAQAPALSRLLDQAMQLALLGAKGNFWPFAEAKAKVALGEEGVAPRLMALLKDIANKDFIKAAKEASQLVLEGDGGERNAQAFSLMRSAAIRTWEKDETQETIQSVLENHPLKSLLEEVLTESRDRLRDFGYMLRALPLSRVQLPPPKRTAEEGEDQEEGDAGAAEPTAEAAAAGTDVAAGAAEEEPKEPPRPPLQLLAESEEAEGLAQLELMRVGPLLQELCNIRFNWRDISRFQYLDLQQVTVPYLTPDAATVATGAQPPQHDEEEDEAEENNPNDDAGAGDGANTKAQKVKEKLQEDTQQRQRSFEILRELLPALVRGATYASAKRADQQLQMMLVLTLNVLLIVGPSPAECVPAGPKSDPRDLDPDANVGAELDVKEEPTDQEGEQEESGAAAKEEEDKEEKDTNDIWLHLAMLAECAVTALMRLKQERSPPQHAPPPTATKRRDHRATIAPPNRTKKPNNNQTIVANHGAGGNGQEGEDEEEAQKVPEAEEAVIQEATRTTKELGASDEELHEMWFDDMPELDLTSIAKVVAFAILCLFHMRRWNSVIVLARQFNDATCFVFATTFLPLLIGAQTQVCHLARRHALNTDRYLTEAKAIFEVEQKKLPRKLLRQLALQGELSQPEQLLNKRTSYYRAIAQRQRRLENSWTGLLLALEDAMTLLAKAVPAAVEQLRKSRVLMADFFRQRQSFGIRTAQGLVTETERLGKERTLKMAFAALTTSYRKSVELLRKRQLTDLVVQSLHELGNLLWLEGDPAGAQTCWSDSIDSAYHFVYAVKNWQKCLESAVEPPPTSTRAESMLLSVVILAKQARLTTPKDCSAHLYASLFASGIVEAVLMNSLPHPTTRMDFSMDCYRLREIFVGLRESRLLLPPNSLHGGVDGVVFLNSLAFFVDTLMATNYQLARCMPLLSLYNYIATDICRDEHLAVRGRLMMVRALVRTNALQSAWRLLFSISQKHDQPTSLLETEAWDSLFNEAPEGPPMLSGATATYSPFRTQEEPFSEHNKGALNQLLGWVLEDEKHLEKLGSLNAITFKMAQAEFTIAICASTRVFSKVGDAVEADRLGFLEKVEAKLRALWKEVTGNDDNDVHTPGACGAEGQAKVPARDLDEKEGEVTVEIRLMLAKIWEIRGDSGKAIQEVLYAMRFVKLLAAAGVRTNQDCNIGGSGTLRAHPGAKAWALLRRQMVNLLLSQGRHKAADAHIEQGLLECQIANDDISRIELLAAKVRGDVLQGKLFELRGERRSGAVFVAKCCLALAAKRLPIPTPSAILVKAILTVILEQNPILRDIAFGPPCIYEQADNCNELLAEVIASYGRNDDPNETLILNAQGKIITSPVAQELQLRQKAASKKVQNQGQQESSLVALMQTGSADSVTSFLDEIDDSMTQCLLDLDALLEVQGFRLHPTNMNSMYDISGDITREPEPLEPPQPEAPANPKAKASAKAAAAPPTPPGPLPEQEGDTSVDSGLFPPLQAKPKKRPISDARESVNIYTELMPLRLHCELRLARCKLDIGDLSAAEILLRQSECRLSRCVFLLPWLYVQFCILKLQWRRLAYSLGVARESPPEGAPNSAVYRDPKAFADGKCPATTSPLFRTFIQRAGVPPLMLASEWEPQEGRDKEVQLIEFLQQLQHVMSVSLKEGGHDYSQLLALLREALEELQRVRGGRGGSIPADAPKTADLAYGLFSALVAVATAKKGLIFVTGNAPAAPPPDAKAGKEAKGAPPPGMIDVAQLPQRVSLDILNGMKRQGFDRKADLAYSAAACQEAQKVIPFKTLVKHSFALRRECDVFGSLLHGSRQLCDSLHVALSQASTEYVSKKTLDQAVVDSLHAPTKAPPANGETIVFWTNPDIGSIKRRPQEYRSVFLFICADESLQQPVPADGGGGGGGGDKHKSDPAAAPKVVRCDDVSLAGLRSLADSLATDLTHCRPATGVAAQHLAMRMRTLARILKGVSFEGQEGPAAVSAAAVLDSAVVQLLKTLRTDSDAAAAAAATAEEAAAAAGGEDGAAELVSSLLAAVLDAEKCRELLRAMVQLLEQNGSAAKVSHNHLSAFLRAVMAPLRCLPV